MNKIVYCSQDFIEEFDANFEMYLPMYLAQNKKEIQRIFSAGNVLESSFLFTYQPLVISTESENPERENIRIIRETMGHIPPSIATQQRLWTAMYNTYYIDHLLDYVHQNREAKHIGNRIKSSVLFTHGRNRSQIVQNLSRLWWLGYYLYDEKNEENPYEYLDFYTSTKDIVGRSTAFFSSNLTNNKEITFGILGGIRKLVQSGQIAHSRQYYVAINKHLNLLGGVVVLDALSRRDVADLTVQFLSGYSK